VDSDTTSSWTCAIRLDSAHLHGVGPAAVQAQPNESLFGPPLATSLCAELQGVRQMPQWFEENLHVTLSFVMVCGAGIHDDACQPAVDLHIGWRLSQQQPGLQLLNSCWAAASTETGEAGRHFQLAYCVDWKWSTSHYGR
jgi:hypothetical protein